MNNGISDKLSTYATFNTFNTFNQKSIVAVDAIRLDTVVWNTYGTLIPMGMVLEANAHLLGTTHLKAGDRVYLPDYQPPKAHTEVKTLWS